ncbi:hypothetical protein [Mesorhizobium sp. USDA 4775]
MLDMQEDIPAAQPQQSRPLLLTGVRIDGPDDEAGTAVRQLPEHVQAAPSFAALVLTEMQSGRDERYLGAAHLRSL